MVDVLEKDARNISLEKGYAHNFDVMGPEVLAVAGGTR